jgi:hypothetical protein
MCDQIATKGSGGRDLRDIVPTGLKIEILPGHLVKIVDSVFGTMPGLDIVQCDPP